MLRDTIFKDVRQQDIASFLLEDSAMQIQIGS